ncbi:MAG: hypothetical protein ACI8WT_003128 [Clostridium sp.]|jgi:hypothetical protein
MNIKTFSYRYAKEILEHPSYRKAFDDGGISRDRTLNEK